MKGFPSVEQQEWGILEKGTWGDGRSTTVGLLLIVKTSSASHQNDSFPKSLLGGQLSLKKLCDLRMNRKGWGNIKGKQSFPTPPLAKKVWNSCQPLLVFFPFLMSFHIPKYTPLVCQGGSRKNQHCLDSAVNKKLLSGKKEKKIRLFQNRQRTEHL